MRRPNELIDEDQVIELVKRADAMLEERRAISSCPPPPASAVRTAAKDKASPGDGIFEKPQEGGQRSAPHPMSDMVTRVSAMPLPPEARPPAEPMDASRRTALGKKRRWDFQADVVTRIIPNPNHHLFETESKPTVVELVTEVQPSSKSQVRVIADPPAQPPTAGVSPPPQAVFSTLDAPRGPASKLDAFLARPRSSLMGTANVTRLLCRRTRWIIGGVGMAGILILVFFFGRGASKATSRERAPFEATHPTTSTPQLTETEKDENTAVSAVEVSGGPESPGPGTVLIYLEGAPKEAKVKVDGVVTTLPLRVTKSSEIVTVTVKAKGYKRWRRQIIPNRERHIPVRMTRKKKVKNQ